LQNTSKIAVVTGANRGLGLETSRQLGKHGFHVILTSRDAERGQRAAAVLAGEGLQVTFHPLDVSDRASVEELAKFTAKNGGLYILVNNAGILPDRSGNLVSAFNADLDAVRSAFETNTVGPFAMTQALLPQMQREGKGRIVNVSSGMGQLSLMGAGYAAYRISKTALNAVTRIFSEEVKGSDILVNAVCPGWVRTDMGGPNATRSISEGVDTIVWAATLPSGGPTGGFFRDRKAIDW
jgi:NAD(P)-dependent dehydrogenase (short-subunit alcohol dehydrogenase family)